MGFERDYPRERLNAMESIFSWRYCMCPEAAVSFIPPEGGDMPAGPFSGAGEGKSVRIRRGRAAVMDFVKRITEWPLIGHHTIGKADPGCSPKPEDLP
jgi:hypothetical protein